MKDHPPVALSPRARACARVSGLEAGRKSQAEPSGGVKSGVEDTAD